MHGGIGFTWDNDTHLWFKRAKSSRDPVRRCQPASRADDAALEALRSDEDHERTNRRAPSAPKCGAWLEANWNPDYGLVEWRNKLIESGWGAPHWPKQWYGRDLPVKFNAVVDEEFARIGAVGVAKAGIRTLAAATILDARHRPA